MEFLLMIVEEKPTMTRVVEAGIAAAAMLAAWMYTAAATELQNPYFHPPHTTEIQNPYFHPPQTSAPTPERMPPDIRSGARASNDTISTAPTGMVRHSAKLRMMRGWFA
jgi:hypothetical protein